VIRLVETEEREACQSAQGTRQSKQSEINAITAKIQKLLDAYLEELIDRDTFTEEKRKFMEQKKTLQNQLESSETSDANAWRFYGRCG
jgi:hypothetical protein